jgi:hypothetical protein
MGRIKSSIAAKGGGLEDAVPVRQMLLGMLAAAIARGVEQRRWRVLAAERPVVAGGAPFCVSSANCSPITAVGRHVSCGMRQ